MLSDLVQKLFTVLVDRRFWFTVVLPFLVLHFGLPEEELTPYIEAVYLLVSTVILNLSWATRPPSGRDFRALTTEALNAYNKLREAGLLK